MSLEDASEWPDLLAIVRAKVKPERDKSKDRQYKKYWWQFGRPSPAMFDAILDLERCLVTAIVSKHLIFSFQPADRVFSHKLYVFPFDTYVAFATLQSRVHVPWAWLLSSTLEERLNYSASDCFETFPFPQADPRTEILGLEEAGLRLYDARAAYMQDPEVWVGLTTTYNRLKDPDNDEPRIVELRHLHEEMDRAVLHAYGWDDIPVPPYCPRTEADHKAIEAFEDEVIDRLFVLNAERAEEERLKGLAAKGSKRSKGRKKKTPSTQPSLFGDDE
ncbi:MAG: hypothetical protein JW990_06765 [Thermoleophilia bacterium]|nr:hypothetical protein [Thermoleophilia bacterium]